MFLSETKQKKNFEIRIKKIKERSLLKKEEYQKFNKLIQISFLNFLNKNNYSNVALYWSINFEVNTQNIIKELLEKKITISLPQVINNKKMIFRKINSLDFDFEYFKNIKQPTKKCSKINPKKIELIVVPLVSYNKKLFRLGYGTGFYDRFLNKYDKKDKIIKVGLGYKFQENDEFFVHKNDKKLNFIFNEEGIIK